MKTKNYVLITGGSEGIGYELARVFAQNGHNLLLVARHEEELEQARESLAKFGVDVLTSKKDLFNVADAFALHDEIDQKGIVIDVLVNNAGQGLYGEFETTDVHRELQIIQLNIASLVVLTKLFLQDMLLRGEGKILNLSSVASKIPGPWQSVYHGTKAFVQSFTEAIRSEVKHKGIVITALLPGATDTDFFNKAGMTNSKTVQEGELADPAIVAGDGYRALMNNEDMVISGFTNKMNVIMGNIMPDEAVAEKTYKKQAPVTNIKTSTL